MPAESSTAAPAASSPAPLPLVYADDDLLLLDKPAGLLCVPGRGADKQDCLTLRVQAEFPDALVVHRLDQATSGLVLMARHREAQRRLSEAFAQRQVHKRYEALVQGQLAPPPTEWGLIDLPLLIDWPQRPRSKVDWDKGKPSQTRWQVLAHLDDATRLAHEPITGRSHQLRVHLLALGHPILGDQLYQDAGAAAAQPRLMLHACQLALPHPRHGRWLHWSSSPPF